MTNRENELLRKAVRRVWAQKITKNPGGWSERYLAGWNDAVDAVVDELQRMADETSSRR
ncbi:hypothetical protein [Streptomyces sp. WAC05858]|uniref:hypothetical protein n=1 Tax=Streptomyces TaxID=1883 RepID=UPI00163C5BD1|nr:hypothetical protein [Streptomyces sp. WAC05858]